MWRELLGRYQVTDIASSVYRDRFGCWGFLDLWRIGAPEFTEADIEFLGHIAGPVTAALRHGLARTFVPATGGDQVPPTGPVVLLLSPVLEVRAQTPQTQRYLRILVPPEAEDQAPVPAGAYNVAAQLLAAEAGVDDNPPVARVHLASGRWLTLRAARMDTTPAAAGGDVAVSIEPSTASDRVSRVRPGVRPDPARDRTSPASRRRRRHPRGRPADVRLGEHRPGSPQVDLRQEQCPQPSRPARPGARHLTARRFLVCAAH